MIDPQELQALKEDINDNVWGWDVDVMLKALIFAELQKLNFNLRQVDFSLRGLVQK